MAARPRWRTVAVAALLFVAGMVTGAALLVGVVRQRLVEIRDEPDAAIERVESSIARRYDLGPEERAAVRSALRRRLDAIAGARRAVLRERITPELEALSDEIEGVLEPHQRERFRDRWGTLRRRWLPPRR